MNRLILFLIRRKLGLKKYQKFRFKNQKHRNECYYFKSDRLWKEIEYDEGYSIGRESGIRLNWLLNDDCKAEIEICQ